MTDSPNQIMPFSVCDSIVEDILAFRKCVIDRKVVAERAYHFVDGQQVPRDQISVVVYPMAFEKTRDGKIKTVWPTCYVVIKSHAAPTDKKTIDALVTYSQELDEYLEGRKQCGASYVMTVDDQFYWFPEILHSQNHFSSLIELRYKYVTTTGLLNKNQG